MDSSCWYDNPVTIKEMERHLVKYPLLETPHGKILESLLLDITYDKCLEIGCGTGQNRQLIKGTYVGMDLPYIIDEIFTPHNEGIESIKHDINDFDDVRADMIKGFDLILLSAFIDVMPEPLTVLDHILSRAKKWVLIHRQDFTDYNPKITKNPSYGGWTYHSQIHIKAFERYIKRNKFKVISERWYDNEGWDMGGSMILEKYR